MAAREKFNSQNGWYLYPIFPYTWTFQFISTNLQFRQYFQLSNAQALFHFLFYFSRTTKSRKMINSKLMENISHESSSLVSAPFWGVCHNLCDISNTTDSVSSDFQTQRRESKLRSRVFLTRCFGQRMKYCLSCLIYLPQSKQKLRSKRRNKIVKIYAN